MFLLLNQAIANNADMNTLNQEYTCSFGEQTVCPQNSTLYLISIYQYLFVGLAFLVGKPFRKSFYTNLWFTGTLIVLLAFNLLVTYNPGWGLFTAPYENIDNGSFSLWATLDFPTYWRNKIVLFAAINAVCTIFWERVVVKLVSLKWKEYRDGRVNAKEDESSLFTNEVNQPGQNEAYQTIKVEKWHNQSADLAL